MYIHLTGGQEQDADVCRYAASRTKAPISATMHTPVVAARRISCNRTEYPF